MQSGEAAGEVVLAGYVPAGHARRTMGQYTVVRADVLPPASPQPPITMHSSPAYTREEEVRYQKLSAIDSKCGSLLALTSVLLVFVSLPPIFEGARPQHPGTFRMIFIALLVSCLISLFVLYFKEDTSEKFVDCRKYALNTAVCLTGVCCLAVIRIVYLSL
jgi:hypothetical protein